VINDIFRTIPVYHPEVREKEIIIWFVQCNLFVLVDILLANGDKPNSIFSSSFLTLSFKKRKHVPCFNRVIETRLQVWGSKKFSWLALSFRQQCALVPCYWVPWEFRDAVKLRYDIPSVCVCEENSSQHTTQGFVNAVALYSNVIKSWETSRAIFWVRCVTMSRSSQFPKISLKNSLVQGPAEQKTQELAFGRVASGIPESYRDQEPQQIHHVPDNDKKRLYSRRMLDV